MDSYSSFGSSMADLIVCEQINEAEPEVELPVARRREDRKVWWSEEDELVVAESSTPEEEEGETSESEDEVKTPGLGEEMVEAWWVGRK